MKDKTKNQVKSKVKNTTSYKQGKRSLIKKKKLSKKKIFIIVLLIVFLLFLGYELIIGRSTQETSEPEEITQPTVEENTVTEEPEVQPEETVQVDLPEKIGSYEVIGQLVIEKLGLEKSILNKTTDDSLNLSVTKLCGPNINEVGNFCITGHNYKNIFKEIKNLEIGDTFYLINKKTKTKVTYKIFDIYSCKPTELKCLYPVYSNKREATLITCNKGARTRLILKAKEV